MGDRVIDILFGFRGQLGRWQYFLWHICGGFLAGFLLSLVFIAMAFADKGRQTLIHPAIMLPFLVFFLPFIWMGFSIQSARIRDIGLRALGVMLTVALIFVVAAVARIVMPEGAVPRALTLLNRGVGIVYSVLLLFAPSGFVSQRTSPDPEDTDKNGRRAPVAAYVAPTKVAAGSNKNSFGRRGLNGT